MSAPSIEAALAVSPLAGQPGLRWRPGVPPVASPMRQAVDAANWIVETDGAKPAFVKIVFDDMRDDIDIHAAKAGAEAAARLGLAPEVLFARPEDGVIATTYLPPPWRPALLDDLMNPEIFQAAVAAKRRFQAGAPLDRRRDVFDRVQALHRRALAAKIVLPGDTEALLAWMRDAAAAIGAAGVDLRPCHNDGSASAHMLHPDGGLMLVDFDEAGQSDPLYDLALLLNEASAFVDPWTTGVESFLGRPDPAVINRCRLYAVADDILQGLRGWFLSATSPRSSVEFLKYGEWRLLRARMALREPGFADRLGKL